MSLEPKDFTVTQDHISLIQHMYVGWDDAEFGAPGIDPKRPYGNSDVYRDIHEILTDGARWPDEDDPEYDSGKREGLEDAYKQLHEETQTALQIFLVTGKMEPGNYEAEAYTTKWVKMD